MKPPEHPGAASPAARIDMLNRRGQQLLKEGKRAAALSTFRESLEIMDTLPEDARTAVAPVKAAVLNHVGALIADDDPAAAIEAHQAALKIFEQTDHNPQAVLNTRLMLADAYQRARKFYFARKHYRAVLEWYRSRMPEERRTQRPLAASVYWHLGNIALEESKAVEAKEKFLKAWELYRELTDEGQEAFRPWLAATLNNLAVAEKLENHYSEAVRYYRAALQEYRQLARRRPEVFLPYLAATFHQLGNAFTEKKDVRDEAAGAAPLTGFGILTLAKKEQEQKAEADRRQAEEYYRQALALYQQLAEQDSMYAPHAATVIHNLGVLYDEHKDHARAMEFYRDALQKRRMLAEADPETFNADVCITIFNMLTLLLARAEGGDAAALDEADALMDEARRRLAIYPHDDGVIGGMKADLTYYRKHFDLLRRRRK